jgi:hypothetical protein
VPINVDSLNIVDILANTGNKRTISTSKIRKIIANKKNRRENGSRADLIGSKPHSNGEFFSRSLKARFESTQPINITTADSSKAIILLNNVLSISTKDTYHILININDSRSSGVVLENFNVKKDFHLYLMGRNHLQFFRFLHIIGMIFTK